MQRKHGLEMTAAPSGHVSSNSTAPQRLQLDVLPRLARHVQEGTTDMAPGVMEVPASTYTSATRWAREREALFLERPVVVGLSGQLPSPGSYTTVEVLGLPLLLVRAGDGTVRTLLNACRHRGCPVVDGCGKARRLTCPFHAWTYDTTGRLVGVPTAEAFEDMSRDDHGLVPFPTAERHGVIVARLGRGGGEVDVDGLLGPELARQLAMYELADWVVALDTHVHRVRANWKVVVDTYRENYHVNALHRDTLAGMLYGGILAIDTYGPHTRNASVRRSFDPSAPLPADEWLAFDHVAVQYGLFPNVILAITKVRLEFWQIFPGDSIDDTIVLHTGLTPPWAPELSEQHLADLDRIIEWTCRTVVDGEDFRTAEAINAGLASGMLDRIVFGRNELSLQHLHRGIDAVLADHA